ncbi:MAG: DUF1501 domain-containing protein [Gemmataceae bacterium]
MSGLLRAQASTSVFARAQVGRPPLLQGGPTQLKPGTPNPPPRTPFAPSPTACAHRLPGVSFSSYFPRLARSINDLAVVRSYASGNGGHTYEAVSTGGNAAKASMSVYANSGRLDQPATASPPTCSCCLRPSRRACGSAAPRPPLSHAYAAGLLGPQYTAFNPAGGSELRQSMSSTLPRERFDDRRLLLSQLDTLRREADYAGVMDRADNFQQQAYEVITRGIQDVFDLSKEDPRVVARYDTSRLFRLEEPTAWYDMKWAQPCSASRCCWARRLCEAGAGFITVSGLRLGHARQRNSPQYEGLCAGWPCRSITRSCRLLEDVKARGLSSGSSSSSPAKWAAPRVSTATAAANTGAPSLLLIAGGGLHGPGHRPLRRHRRTPDHDPLHAGPPVRHGNALGPRRAPCSRLRIDINRDIKTAMEGQIAELF